MEKIRNRLTQNEQDFLDNFSLYIDNKIYLYGSILRPDFIKGKSDLDLAVFTDNDSSTIQKICGYLDIKKSEFRKIVYKIDNTIVYGYKYKYKNDAKHLNIEIAVYNEKYSSAIQKQLNKANQLPYIVLLVLYIVKWLYYTLGIISEKTYSKVKNFCMHSSNERNFILL